jgi:outer membrane protein TolC
VDVSVDAGLAGADLTRTVPENLRADDPGATLGDRVRRDLGASAAVHVHLPVLDRAARPARQARQDALDAAHARRDAEAMAQRRRALGLLAEWRAASHQLQAAQQTSERAERNLLKIKSLYSAGATTLLDLLDARRVYDDARERLAAARQQNRMAQFQIEDRK